MVFGWLFDGRSVGTSNQRIGRQVNNGQNRFRKRQNLLIRNLSRHIILIRRH